MPDWWSRTAIVAVVLLGVVGGCGGPRSDGTVPSQNTSGSEATVNPSGIELPAFIVIRRLDVHAEGGTLRLTLALGAAVPAGTPPVGMLAYRFLLDTDDDGAWDRSASLELRPGGGFTPVLLDRRTGKRQEGAGYPGTANVAGSDVDLTLPLEALGCPTTIGVRGMTEQTVSSVIRSDAAPGPQQWTRIDVACP